MHQVSTHKNAQAKISHETYFSRASFCYLVSFLKVSRKANTSRPNFKYKNNSKYSWKIISQV